MKPTTDTCLNHERLSSANTSDVKTFTVPRGASHVYVQAFTNDAFVTLDGSAPTVGGPGIQIIAAQMPWFVPIGQGSTIKHISTVAAPSVLIVSYLQ